MDKKLSDDGSHRTLSVYMFFFIMRSTCVDFIR